MSRRERQQGQGIVEFTLALPVILLIVLSVAELGLAFGNLHTLGYASREGARVGSALALGGVTDCLGGDDPSGVDAAIVGAVQRIIESPSSGIDLANIDQIRIFRATSSGAETSQVNVWNYYDGLGFVSAGTNAWPACRRDNSANTPDSIGVTVRYRHELNTPLPSVVNAIADGTLAINLSETTVMSLNPSV